MNSKKSKKKAVKKKQVRTAPEKRRRRLTAVDVQNIRNLAESIGNLVPLSGYRSSFTLTKIAIERGLSKYLPKKAPNKKESVASFLQNLFVYRPRTAKLIIREILPQAIERRRSNGDPILLEEAENLASQLMSLEVDMRAEILALQFPEDRPTIVPPPIEIQQMLRNFHLHQILMPECQKMFIDGHLNESVRKALEKFETAVQQISTLNEIGADLMGKAFNEKGGKIQLNSLSSPSEINEQEGFKLMTMGMMRGWRNNLSHGNQPQILAYDAFGRLVLISNFFHRLDKRVAP